MIHVKCLAEHSARVTRYTWNDICEMIYVKMINVKWYMWNDKCAMIYVKWYMWNEMIYVQWYMWNDICEMIYVKMTYVKWYILKRLIHEWKMIHVKWYTWNDTCEMFYMKWHTHACKICETTLPCLTWLIHVCDMTMCDMTHLYVWHDSFTCVTWLIHMFNMTHSCVWNRSIIC